MIFYLEQVGDNAVSGAALHKVPLSCKELFRVELTKLLEEVFQQRHLAVLLDLVKRDGVEHRLYEPTVIGDYRNPKTNVVDCFDVLRKEKFHVTVLDNHSLAYLALSPD